jgi:hypothetical protein
VSHKFEYQAPDERQAAAIQKIRASMKSLHDELVTTIPECRERSLAVTKLEEASMWANKAIVFAGAVHA